MTHGLFLFEIPAVFYQLGKETIDMKSCDIVSFVKQQLEIRAFDTYHSLMWQQAENAAIDAFTEGYKRNGYSFR